MNADTIDTSENMLLKTWNVYNWNVFWALFDILGKSSGGLCKLSGISFLRKTWDAGDLLNLIAV